MSRQIKFRFWDYNKNEMIYSDWYNLFYEFFEQVVPCGEEDKCQQFTGLKDKNNKEIYEGDIIKFWAISIPKTYINWDYTKPIFGESKRFDSIGSVVFDVINDIDDFYSPYVLGWGIKLNLDRITSLNQVLKDYSNFKEIDSTYGKMIERDYEIIGNIFETPELLNEK